MSESSVLCVMCGYDTRIGRRLKTHRGSAIEVDEEDLGELPTHGVEALDRAERQIALAKIEQQRLLKGAPWWMLLLALLGLIGFAAGMLSMPQDRVMINSGIILQVAGWLISTFYGLRIWIVAFKESVLQGILYMVPFYNLYYVVTRWDRVAGFFILGFVGGCVSGLGIVLVTLSSMVNTADDSDKSFKRKSELDGFSQPTAVVLVCRDVASI